MSPAWLPTNACSAVRPAFERFGDRSARHLAVRAFVPLDRKRVERGLGLPPGVGHDRDRGVADLEHLLDALHAGNLGGVEALYFAAEHRAFLDRGVQHARQLQVEAVDLLAGHLVGGVEPLQRLAGDLPVLRVLELGLLRHREFCSGVRHLAERGLLAVGSGDDAFLGLQLLDRDLPLVGRGLQQHHAGRGAALTDVLVRLADAAAAAGRVRLPDALALHVLTRRRILVADLRPVAFELFGDQLGEAGDRALTHLGAGHADHHGVVRLDHHPGAELRHVVGERQARGPPAGRSKPMARPAPAAAVPTTKERRFILGTKFMVPSLMPWPRRGSRRAPAGRCRSGRYW